MAENNEIQESLDEVLRRQYGLLETLLDRTYGSEANQIRRIQANISLVAVGQETLLNILFAKGVIDEVEYKKELAEGITRVLKALEIHSNGASSQTTIAT